MHRKYSLIVVVFVCAVALAGCPKDPYRAAIQGSADVSQAVASAVKITGSYYSAGTIDDAKKAKVAGYLNLVTDCNLNFRKGITNVHSTGQTGIAAFLPVADGFVQCVRVQASVAADPQLSNILQAVDTAVNGVSLAVATAKGAK